MSDTSFGVPVPVWWGGPGGILANTFRQQTTAHWLGKFRDRVPIGPVNSLGQALADEQVLEGHMITQVDHPVYGRVREAACPIKPGGGPAEPVCGPQLGQDTRGVLEKLLGYTRQRIESLAASGAIGQPEK